MGMPVERGRWSGMRQETRRGLKGVGLLLAVGALGVALHWSLPPSGQRAMTYLLMFVLVVLGWWLDRRGRDGGP